MALIFVDTVGQSDLAEKTTGIDSDDDLDFNDCDINPTKIAIESKNVTKKGKRSTNDIDLDEFETEMGWRKGEGRRHRRVIGLQTSSIEELAPDADPVKKALSKTAIKPGFERLNRIPRYDVSRRTKKLRAERERERTKGKKWFNMPATEMTDEIKHDLEIIQMRSVLDPKHFYKKNDMKALPKFFQIGKVVDTPLDYYNGRLTKKERKRTIVDELMADAEFAKYNKRKYKEIVDEKRQQRHKAHRHARKLKGKNK